MQILGLTAHIRTLRRIPHSAAPQKFVIDSLGDAGVASAAAAADDEGDDDGTVHIDKTSQVPAAHTCTRFITFYRITFTANGGACQRPAHAAIHTKNARHRRAHISAGRALDGGRVYSFSGVWVCMHS